MAKYNPGTYFIVNNSYNYNIPLLVIRYIGHGFYRVRNISKGNIIRFPNDGEIRVPPAAYERLVNGRYTALHSGEETEVHINTINASTVRKPTYKTIIHLLSKT